jgi:hypothetical protein
MALKDKRKEIVEYVEKHQAFIATNHEAYEIYNGSLKKFVEKILTETLSEQYLQPAKSRMVLINILERYVDKVSCAYENPPMRKCAPGFEQYQEVIDYYIKVFNMNVKGQVAEKYSHLMKGYAWEPFIDSTKEPGEPKLRVIPFDRFLPYSDNQLDPSEETLFISFMGTRKSINGKNQRLFYTYTKDEFDAFTEDGESYLPALEENQGVNPYGVIPQTYGRRSENELLPFQDTDILSIAKLIPVFLSDLSMAFMYQCFTIIFGIDIDLENAKLSPNALWSIKSDQNSDKPASIGTIKPEADTDKGMAFILNVFVFWLETKGIRVGSVGKMDAGNVASGVSKLIDEMDVYKVVKESIQWFQKDEEEFWQKMIPIHNNWVETKQIEGLNKLPEDLEVIITFPEPQPKRAKKDIIEEKKLEVEAGFKSKKKAIQELNPDYTEEELQAELDAIGDNSTEQVDTEQPEKNNSSESESESESESDTQNQKDVADQVGVNAMDVRKETLNGAQVTAMVEVVLNYKQGNIDADSAKEILVSAFNILPEDAARIVGKQTTVNPLEQKQQPIQTEIPAIK